MKITVIICTRNRVGFLNMCLSGLINQKNLLYQVIVVDNNSNDSTKEVCKLIGNSLPIKYVFEKKISLAVSRNTGIRHAKGNIVAFLDDDCVPTPNWVANIVKHFETFSNSDGVLGKTLNFSPKDLSETVEHFYYRRWVLSHTLDLHEGERIQQGTLVDFKNAAFKKNLFKNVKFVTDLPYNVGDEDSEIGARFIEKNYKILFDPKILVFHQYPNSVYKLIKKNYFNGTVKEFMYEKYDYIKETFPTAIQLKSFYISLKETMSELPISKMPLFFVIIILYSFIYKLGKIRYRLMDKSARIKFLIR